MNRLLVLVALLTACAGGDTPKTEVPQEPPKPAGPTELNVYIWTNYHSPAMIERFEKEFNARVQIDTYDNNEVIEQKLQSGAAAYDIVVPTDYMVASLTKQGLLLELDEARLPNLKHLDPVLDNTKALTGKRTGVAYLWGTTGFAYRTDKVSEKLDSWNAVFDPKYKGKVVMLDDMRECFNAALRVMGKDPNTTDPADIEAAKKKLQAQKPLLLAYDSSDFAGKIQAGDGWVVQGYSGELANVARESGGTITYVVPKEGATLAVDNLAIPKSSKNVDLAYSFINFMLDPEVAADTANVTGYATANRTAREKIKPELVNDPAVYPPDEVLRNCQPIKDLGDKTPLYDAAWTEVKAM